MKVFITISLMFFAGLQCVKGQVGLNDATFNPGSGFNAGVISTDVQTDDKILAAGTFTSYNGATANRVTRLNSDGSKDLTFTTTNANNSVYKVKQLSNGKIFLCGQFTSYAGLVAQRVVMLNADGTKDAAYSSSTGANNLVYSFAEQSDGKIVIGGHFTNYKLFTINRVARINADGSRDITFNPGTGANNLVYDVALQSDGKILVGGAFTSFNSDTSYKKLVRLNSDGSIDNSFSIGTSVGSTTATGVKAITVQSDGKIIVAGTFTAYNGTPKNNIVRLNTDGSVDNSFNNTGANNTVNQIKIQNDGKLIIVGVFTTFNGQTKNRIVRLNTDGTIDNTFQGSGADNTIFSSSIQSDGNIIIGGTFLTYSGVSRKYIARIINTCSTVSLTSSITNNLCNGGSSASATVTPTGGSSFTYTWSPTGGNTSVASGLNAGTYSCTVANECGNSSIITVTLTDPAPISVATGTASSVCVGSSVTIDATASNGTGPYTYTWMPGTLVGDNQSVSPSSTTNYTVDVTDANGCLGSGTQNITVNALPVVSISGGTATVCSGGQIIITGTGATTYLWNTGATTSTLSIAPVSTTDYTVTGTNNNGCSNDAVKTITVSGTCAAATVPCGKTITNMFQTQSATTVSGAVNYRFKFYNSVSNVLVATKIQSSPTCTFSSVSGIYYQNTYKWTVAVDKGSGFGPESNNNCTITFAAPTNTVPCGKTFSNLSSYTTVQSFGKVSNYRFKFYDNVTNALLATKTQASNYIYFNQVSPSLAYGRTYNWTVEMEYDNGSGLVYSAPSNSACAINFNAPQTVVPCGKTYASNSAYTSVAPVSGGLAYRYSFYDNVTNALVATKTNTNTYIYFNQVSGLIFNKTYKWTVEVQYFNGTSNVFGPASSNTCTMTWGAASKYANPEDVYGLTDLTAEDEARIAKESNTIVEEVSTVTFYPNPTKDVVHFESNSEIKTITVTNISGAVVLRENNTYEVNLSDLPTGLYFIEIKTDKGFNYSKVIKE